MLDFLDGLTSGAYAPHGYCLLWQPGLIWTHAVSDTLIALSYFSIPIAMAAFLRRRPDVEFGAVGWLFATFILACGMTHVMAVWDLWHGDYALEGVVKAITAAASVPTALLLWQLLPRAVALPSPRQLQEANGELEQLVSERDNALAKLTREIQHRERAEAALVQAQKIDAVGQLTGGIAHDFNNLLQALAGNLDLIRRKPEDREKVERWAANGIKSIERGTKLTSQLLAFSRTQRMELKPLDVNHLVEGVTELVERTLGPSVELRTMIAEEPCAVRADPTQLELAILNLAINARDAMPDGGSLILSTRLVTLDEGEAGAPPGDYVEIGVSDTGTGMTAEIAARALEPFFTTKPLGQGTGLGLSMAYGVARQSGGTLEIATAPSEGTTIRVLLPCALEAVEPRAPAVPVAETPDAGPARAGARIMLVDDDHDVRGSLGDSIEGLGYDVIAVASPFAALQLLDQERPDALVLDFAMPEMNGAEFARQARVRHPDLPIIFVSGYADSNALDAVMDERSATLRKPFKIEELAALLAERA